VRIGRNSEHNAMISIHPETADNIKREKGQRPIRRNQVGLAVFAVFMGLFLFFGVADQPCFETYHKQDVMRLILAGSALEGDDAVAEGEAHVIAIPEGKPGRPDRQEFYPTQILTRITRRSG